MSKMPSPMLGASQVPPQFEKNPKYMAFYSEKMDGFRALIFPNGVVYSRSGKVIRNIELQKIGKELSNESFVFDCEIWKPGLKFQQIASCISSENGNAIALGITFHCFDAIHVDDFNDAEPSSTFNFRHDNYLSNFKGNIVEHKCLYPHEAKKFFEEIIAKGGEGLIGRDPFRPYKHGRSTINEAGMFKMKYFADDEATVISYQCQKKRKESAEKKVNGFGYAKQSTKKGDFEDVESLGSLVVQCKNFDETFSIGTGFTEKEREELWAVRDSLIGKVVLFDYQPCGTKDVPRCPSFKSFKYEI